MTGRIFRLGPDGLGYLRDDASGQPYTFRYSQVDNPPPESPFDLNGRVARFDLDPDSRVKSVHLEPEP